MANNTLHVNRIFRDDEETDYVGIVRALRGFEVEFEIFGTAYWQDGSRHYLASANAETLHGHLVRLQREGRYPIAPQVWTERLLVPAGWDKEVEQQVKVNCCKSLRDTFPAEFWESADRVANGKENNSAVPLLESIRDEIEGVFDSDSLQVFESLVERAHLRRNLTDVSFNEFTSWLEEERRCMADDGFDRAVFTKDMYGFAQRGESGNISVFMDSVRKNVEKKRRDLCRSGLVVVTPIFHKKVGYNREYRLVDARRDFKAELARVFDGNYFELLASFDSLPVAVDRGAYFDELERLRDFGLPEVVREWTDFGRQWGITL